MKKNKVIKFIAFFIGCLIVGFIVGFIGGILLKGKDFPPFQQTIENSYPFVLTLTTIILAFGIISYFIHAYKLKKDVYSDDENSYYTRNETCISISSVSITIAIIINSFSFALIAYSGFEPIYPFIIWIAIALIGFLFETRYVKLTFKVRPELDCDPSSFTFKDDYFDNLDEFEKIKMGKASFKTFSFMIGSFASMLMVCAILCSALNITPLICLPIAILWIIHTVYFTIVSIRLERSKQK